MSTTIPSITAISHVVAYKRYVNSLRPVSSLPPEILLEVFRILWHQWYYDQGQHLEAPPSVAGYITNLNFRAPFDLGWIQVSHVCHRWRTILLDHPSMWATIDCERASIPWVEEMLRRAHPNPGCSVPVDFTVNTASELGQAGQEDEVFVNALRVAVSPPYSACLVSLQITSWNQGVLDLLKTTLPRLEILGLQQPEEEGVWVSSFPARDLTSFAPSLKRLVMFQCSIFLDPADTSTFPELLYLSIECSIPPELMEAVNRADQPTAVSIAGLFDRMPKLEEFDLHDAVPYMLPDLDNPQHEPSPFRISSTIKRASLTACYCSQHCARLATDMATSSPHTVVKVHLDQCGFDIPGFPRYIHDAIEARAGFSHPPKTLQLSITEHPHEHSAINLQTWFSGLENGLQWPSDPSYEGGEEFAFAIATGSPPCPGLYVDQLEAVEVGLALDEGVETAIARVFLKEEWSRTFARARKVRKIIVVDVPSAFSLFEALVEGLEGNEPSSPSSANVLFPSLQSVAVFPSASRVLKVQRHATERFMECLRSRQRHGYAIAELYLPNDLRMAHLIGIIETLEGTDIIWNDIVYRGRTRCMWSVEDDDVIMEF